jgi:hypothetical protein
MGVTLLATSAGLLLGSGWAVIADLYLFYTHSYRQARNLLVIGFGSILIGTVGVGSMFLLQSFCRSSDIIRHTSSYCAALFAYAIGGFSVVFIAVRAEFRWRKSVGLDDKSLMSKQRNTH